MRCSRCGRFGARYVADEAWPHDEVELCKTCCPDARARLQAKIAQKDAERGRPLTASEKLDNLRRAIFEENDGA